ncbi:WG containing repeat-containing protein [Dyadobacter koreensis]|uniref:WG containing repeat-containing protein n=1 Tax=Dyadobacter koreensis TaxID=408657 RepID=A0A1H6WQ45_9BACT|nr:WG repeat-containing protein [Dyadobacter koreensis]SEJ16317.1 WG containing repeat-containing protein [Dyadobacter koreensis]
MIFDNKSFKTFLTILSIFSGLNLAMAQRPAWLEEYNEHQAYKDIYVVKKINNTNGTYSSFLVDKNGKKLTPAYRDIGKFSNGLAEFVTFENHKGALGMHGYLNKNGRIIIPPIYRGAGDFQNGITYVIYPKGKQMGLSYLDTLGKEIYKVPVELFPNDFLINKAKAAYVAYHDCQEDFIWYVNDNVTTLNWKFGKYTEADIKKAKEPFRFYYKGKYGVVDKNLILRVPVALDDIDLIYKHSGRGLARVRYGDKFGYISSKTGEVVIPFIYEDTQKPSLGRYWVKKGGKWGCINKKGETVIPFLYEYAGRFMDENRASVSLNGKFGHIDTTGRVTTPIIYQSASYFKHGVAMIQLDNKYAYIDTSGKVITKQWFSEAQPFREEMVETQRFGLFYEVLPDGSVKFKRISGYWKGGLILLGLVLLAIAPWRFFKARMKGNR